MLPGPWPASGTRLQEAKSLPDLISEVMDLIDDQHWALAGLKAQGAGLAGCYFQQLTTDSG